MLGFFLQSELKSVPDLVFKSAVTEDLSHKMFRYLQQEQQSSKEILRMLPKTQYICLHLLKINLLW